MQLNIRHIYPILILAAALLLSACNSTRRVPDGEYLLTSTDIKVEGRDVKESEVEKLIRNKPNKKMMGLFKFNLFVWNLFDGEKLEEKNEKKRAKLEEKNKKREKKGKDPKEFKPVLGYRIKHNVGEAPVLLDTVDVRNSMENIKRYLKNNGFFNAEADYSVELKEKRKKAEVQFEIQTKDPYRIKEVAYTIDDTALIKDVNKVVQGTLLKNGDIFKMTNIDKERLRLTEAMRNRGYFDFNRNYITYEVDSTVGDRRVFIRQVINNPTEKRRTAGGEDTLIEKQHIKYEINNVYVDPYYSTEYDTDEEDTLTHDGIIFFNRSKLLFNPEVINNAVYVRPGDIYRQESQEYTYNRLSALNNFRFINISFQKSQSDSNAIDCYIKLTPVIRQAAAAELEGTHTGGNLGISGNLSYTNRNTFGSAEVLSIRLRGGLEAQQTNAPTASEEQEGGSRINDINPFNTVEYGLETSIAVPDLLIPKKVTDYGIPGYNKPKTSVNLGYNFQNRPDFTRNFFNGSYAYYWTGSSEQTNEYSFYPLQLNVIGISKRPFFERRLDEIGNEFLKNTYSNHLIAGTKFHYTRSNQNMKKRANSYWNRVFVETAGNGLKAVNNALGTEEVDGHYELFGIRYAQFIKVSNDLRLYRHLTQNSQLVYRLYTGVAVPYGNLNVVPFDKSFFAGGANDIRGWVARSLGPGSAPSRGVNQVGDIILEGNVEYRAKFTQVVEMGLFTDVGNVWLTPRPEVDQRAVFDFDRFYKEFAVSPGIGLRLDFSFLLARIDWAFQMRDPALPEGERWLFQPKDQYNSSVNSDYSLRSTWSLGIGYPF